MTAYESSENGSFEAGATPGRQDLFMAVASSGAKVRPQFFYTPGEPVTVAPEAGFAGCYVLRHEPDDVRINKKETYAVQLYLDRAAGRVTCTINDDGKALIVDVPAGFTFEQLARAIRMHFNPHPNPNEPEPKVPIVTGSP
jgi:hypothetical protein